MSLLSSHELSSHNELILVEGYSKNDSSVLVKRDTIYHVYKLNLFFLIKINNK